MPSTSNTIVLQYITDKYTCTDPKSKKLENNGGKMRMFWATALATVINQFCVEC